MSGTEQYVITTSDPFGNTVSLTNVTWRHIVEAHVDMTGHLRAIRSTVENPAIIYESTADEAALIFHGIGLLLPRPNIVRVVIRYDSMVDIRVGETEGYVVTAFAPSPTTQFSGQIGPEFYRRPKKAKPRKR